MHVRRRWMGSALVLAVLTLGTASGRSAVADEPPISVVDWLKARGEDASFDARRTLFARLVGGAPYVGSAEQNVRLMNALTTRGESEVGKAPGGGGGASQPRTIRAGDLEVTYDPSSLVVRLELEESGRWTAPVATTAEPREASRTEEAEIFPTLPTGGSSFVSAAVLSQKAKQFDDGLYAAVEEALEEGADGKRQLLLRLRERLAAAGARDQGTEVVEAAARLGAVPGQGPDGVEAAVTARLAEFEADPKRSKPIGFYPWSDELKRVFRQDRMLQSPIPAKDAHAIVEALKADPASLAAYRRMLRCYERLTNAYALPDLRGLIDSAAGPASDEPVSILPPSHAHETDLVKRLWSDRPVPEGANLAELLIAEIRAGRIRLEPTATSGWYDRQTWALEPFLRPDAMPEAPHLQLGDRYRAYLVECFKGLLALTRETHVKQLELGKAEAMAAPPSRPAYVALPFTVEPLPTHYDRRAEAYAFVRGVLEETFGAPRVAPLHRRTAEGSVALDLATEAAFMEALYRGAADVARAEIGAADPASGPAAQTARETFGRWAASHTSDPDLAVDARMMVPVFYDELRRRTKVWVFLGWTRETLYAAVVKPPRVLSTTKHADMPDWNGQVDFHLPAATVYAPVVAEVYVSELLDRTQMRARCDEHRTRGAILSSLR